MYHVVQIIQSYDVISKRPLGCQSGHMIGSFAPVPRVLSTSITGRNTAKSIHSALFPTESNEKVITVASTVQHVTSFKDLRRAIIEECLITNCHCNSQVQL